MELDPIGGGLARWVVPHPAWEAGAAPDSPADWPQDVACVAARVGPRAVFIDPLLPEDPDELWPALDSFVNGAPVTVLTTIRWHGRSRDALLERYEGVADLPAGVVAMPVPDETMFWLPEHATLVAGDRLIGDGDGGLRMCPESWLHYIDADPPVTHDDLRGALMALLELPVERILVSHGDPVLSGAQAALASALAG